MKETTSHSSDPLTSDIDIDFDFDFDFLVIGQVGACIVGEDRVILGGLPSSSLQTLKNPRNPKNP